jgi:hypothetical protein
VASDLSARLWDAANGRQIAAFKHVGRLFGGAAFSPDSRRLATAEDNTARLWDAATGKEIGTLKGHAKEVVGVAFSPDGRWLLTASEDDTARLWDAADGRELAVLRGHTAPVESAVFSRDGKLIATTSSDSTVRLWPFPWTSAAELIDTAIARVPRCLFEWERRNLFVGDDVPAWCYALAKPPFRPRRYGFSYDAVDAARARRLGLASPEGLAVDRIIRGLTADQAGLKVDDVLLQADGAPVSDRRAFTEALDRVPPRGSMRLTVLRAGQRLEIELKAGF